MSLIVLAVVDGAGVPIDQFLIRTLAVAVVIVTPPSFSRPAPVRLASIAP